MNELNIDEIGREKQIKELINFSIVNIDKPSGCTSFDVANRVRKLLDLNKTGHLGTLDPNVTGVLPICLGNACKIQEYFMHRDKVYVGKMKLHKNITKEQLKMGMKKFIGKINQLPPRKSRVKRILREREVVKFELTKFSLEKLEAEFIAHVQAGTYIRKLCSDLGESLGVGIQMSELRRNKAGLFSSEDKEFISLENFEKLVNDYNSGKKESEENLRKILIPAEIIIQLLPFIEVNSEFLGKLKHGSPIFEEMLINVKEARKIIDSKASFCVLCDKKLVEIAKFDEEMSKSYPNILAKPSVVLIS